MSSLRSQFATIISVAALLSLPAGSRARDLQVQEPTVTTAPGPLPGALAEGTSAEVAVTYENGMLTINARNARLSDILRRICDKTGAVLDALSVDEEGVFVDLGPGPVRDVLGALLNNSTFNYAMVGSTGNPNGLARVVVFPGSKNGDAEERLNQQPLASTTANMPGQIEALIKSAAAGEAVDETALFQAAAQLARDTSSSSLSSPRVDPGDPLRPSRSRHRRR